MAKKINPDYFLSVDDDLLSFLERKGEVALDELNNSYKSNKDNAFKLLSILILGIGASILLISGAKNIPELICLASFAIGWITSSLNITINVLTPRNRLIANRPPSYEYTYFYKNLNELSYAKLKNDGYKGAENCLSILRRDRLSYLDNAFAENMVIAKKVSRELNISIWTASLTPLFSISFYAIICLLV